MSASRGAWSVVERQLGLGNQAKSPQLATLAGAAKATGGAQRERRPSRSCDVCVRNSRAA